ncbi:MAG TPA: hypothetical protein VHS28_08020 [Chloroflexota bacterium]|nr:hypothetical protein [Chloroflexota bacterium]
MANEKNYVWADEAWEYRTRLLDAIREGRKDEALAIFEKYEKGKTSQRMGLMKVIDTLFAVLLEKADEEIIPEVFRRNPYSSPLVEVWEKKVKAGQADWRDFPLKEYLYQRLDVFRHNHDEALGFYEDDQKYVLTLRHCKSGAAMIDQYDDKLAGNKKPHQWSLGRKGLFAYCVSCPLRWEVDWLNEHGYPLPIQATPARPGGSGPSPPTRNRDREARNERRPARSTRNRVQQRPGRWRSR